MSCQLTSSKLSSLFILYLYIISIFPNEVFSVINRQSTKIDLVFIKNYLPGKIFPASKAQELTELKSKQTLKKFKTELLTYSWSGSNTNFHLMMELNSDQIVQATQVRFPNNLWHDDVLREIKNLWPNSKVSKRSSNNTSIFTWEDAELTFIYESACIKTCFPISLLVGVKSNANLFLKSLYSH
ncbi:MAG: hypothetical protein QE271_05630 [Bacteriovoracaceae bacterium]|nr:hypothetical protein [Bacteriovoracaceae bacterium]